MNIVFSITGGIGKHIMATAVCKGIKTKFPDSNLIVITGYPEIFYNHPAIHRIYHPASLGFFYENHVKDQKVLLLNQEPYSHESYIFRKKHLIETWFQCLNLEYRGEHPELFTTSAEHELSINKMNSSKPRLVFQPFGQSSNGYNWVRDIPLDKAQQLADYFSQHFEVLHIRSEHQASLQNTTPITSTDLRDVFQTIKHAHARLLIDSFAQHAAAALHSPSVVCWIGNSPQTFGYSIHKNILANPPNMFTHNISNNFEDYSFMNPVPAQCPYISTQDIFNTQLIIDAITLSFDL